MAGLEELLAQQEHAMNKVYRMLPNFKKLGQANWTLAVIKQRLTWLEAAFAKCKELDLKIQIIATETQRVSINYFVANLYYQCEEVFHEAAGFMANAQSAIESSSSSSATNTSTSSQVLAHPMTRLPQISLPSFSGANTEWENFRDQFKSLIHDDGSLSNFQPMHYLKASLHGEALRALCNITVTDSNYAIAWDILVARYENKRRIVSEHLSAVCNFTQLKLEDLSGLRDLRDTTNASLQALRNLNRPVDSWPDVIIFIVTKKFDPTTKRAWETRLGDSKEFPTYQELDQFLASRIQILEAVHEDKNHVAPQSFIPGKRTGRLVSHYASAQDSSTMTKGRRKAEAQNMVIAKCLICNDDHWISRCPRFLSLSVAHRAELVENKRLCKNCLSSQHFVKTCSSIHCCRICANRHHTLLHSVTQECNTYNDNNTSQNGDQTVTSNLTTPVHPIPAPVLLATARIRIITPDGRWAIARALLDQGSAATLISENLARSLRVRRKRCSLRIAGINGGESHARHTARINITSTDETSPTYSVDAIILSSLTQYAPSRLKCSTPWSHTRHLQLADPDPFSLKPIDLVIGADLYGQILRDGVLSGSVSEPTAQNTVFGWILSGRVSTNSDYSTVPSLHITVLERIEEQLRQFWEIEEVSTTVNPTPEEQKCEDHFCVTHTRNNQGRYIVRLPFISDAGPELGESRINAARNLQRLERRLNQDAAKQIAYSDFMREYETLGHMTRIPDAACSHTNTYYIPHHAVMRQSSKTSNLRVVFNASATTSNGRSLNDFLAVGPKLQIDLAAVILRWQQYEFVLTADIAKMYRQILIHTDDVDYQRVLWRPSPAASIETFQLRTVTYGTTSAPFLALRVLRQLINDDGRDFPLAAAVLRHQTYVDDCLFGAETEESAIQTRDQLISLLSQGGFRLRKWASNCRDLLQGLDPTDHGLALDKELYIDESLHVLGIHWQPNQDLLHFKLNLPTIPGNTKRTILSTIARFYDPLGWLTPVIVLAKTFMQTLWALKCDWDQQVPCSIQTDWNKFYAELPSLEEITIPRWTGFSSRRTSYELHGFADASMTAYAAAIYIRCTSPNRPALVTLLIAKSRVAPLKTMSIPRLELCAAQLLAKLLNFVTSTIDTMPRATYCWTDSTIVLAWLQQPATKWKTFVANRVSTIQTLTPAATWRHVPTQENPADCASRGVFPTNILHHSLWWKGPAWLTQDESVLSQPAAIRDNEHRQEERITYHHVVTTPMSWNLQHRFSSWSKLLRVTALVIRFVRRLRRATMVDNVNEPNDKTQVGRFCYQDFQAAKRYWLKIVQRDTFTKELEAIRTHQRLASSSVVTSHTRPTSLYLSA